VTSFPYPVSTGLGFKGNTETKTMVINRKDTNLELKVESEHLEQVKEFTYLHAIITDYGACDKVIS